MMKLINHEYVAGAYECVIIDPRHKEKENKVQVIDMHPWSDPNIFNSIMVCICLFDLIYLALSHNV